MLGVVITHSYSIFFMPKLIRKYYYSYVSHCSTFKDIIFFSSNSGKKPYLALLLFPWQPQGIGTPSSPILRKAKGWWLYVKLGWVGLGCAPWKRKPSSALNIRLDMCASHGLSWHFKLKTLQPPQGHLLPMVMGVLCFFTDTACLKNLQHLLRHVIIHVMLY